MWWLNKAARENYLVRHVRTIYLPFFFRHVQNIHCRIVYCRRRANLCTLEKKKNNIALVKFGTTALQQNASRNWIFATRFAKYGRAKSACEKKPLSDSSCALENVHRY